MRTLLGFGSTALVAAVLLGAGSAAAGISMVGFKGGLSASTLHGDLPTDPFVQNGTRLGLGGGVFFTFGLGGLLSLQPEVLFTAKGTSLGTVEIVDEAGNHTGTADVSEVLEYLEIPLLARVSLPEVRAASPFVVAGPAWGVRLSQKLKVSGFGSDDISFFRRNDVGFALGAGVGLGHGRVRWSLETRYTLGIVRSTGNSYSDNARNGDLLVMVGLGLPQ